MVEREGRQLRMPSDADRHTMPRAKLLQAIAKRGPDAADMAGHVDRLELADCRERGHGANAFGPIRTRNERVGGARHRAGAPNHRGHRMAVPQRLREYGDIWLQAVQQVSAAQRESPTGRNFINHQQGAGTIAQFADARQKAFVWLNIAGWLHDDRGQIVAMLFDNRR